MSSILVGCLLGAIGLAFMSQAEDKRQKALTAPFEAMEKAVKDQAEAPFKACWHPGGFEKNLVGGSGLAGKEVFDQGSRKRWFLKADLARATWLAESLAVIVPCDIWAWEKGKAVDQVDLLLVREKDGYRVLGGGEKREQVDALASRWLKKEPLEAPRD